MSASTTQTQTPRRLRTSTKIESHSLISCISNQSIPYDRIQTNIPSIKQSYTKKRRIQQPINTTSIQQEPICKGIVRSFIKNYPKNSTTPSVDDDNFIYLKRKTLPYNPHLQSIMNPLKPKEQRKFIQIEKTSFTVEHEKRRDTSSLADVELKIPPTAYKTFRNEIQFMNCLNESDSMKLEKEYNLLLKMNKDINKEEVHTNTTSALKLKGKQDKENFSFINGQSETNITFNESISLNLRPQRNQNIPLQRPSLLNMNHNSALNSRSIKKKSYIETRKSVLNDADNVSVLSRSNPFESILKIVLRKKKNDLIKVHANQAETSFSNHLLDKSVDFHSVPNVIHRRIGPDSPKKLAFKDCTHLESKCVLTNNADRIFKKRYKIALDETSNSIDIVDMNIKEESFLLNTLESILPRRPSNQSLTSKTSSMKLAHVLPFNPKFEFLEEDSCVTSKQITVELIDSPQSSIILSNTSSTNPQPTYYNISGESITFRPIDQISPLKIRKATKSLETKYASINEFQSIALADEISHDRNDKSSSLDQSILIEKSSHLSHHMKEKDHSQKQSVFDDISFSNFDSDQYQTDSLLPSSIQDEDFKIIHDNTEPRSLELCEMNVMGSKEESTESLSTYENMRIINCINDAESIIILDPECTKISSSLAFEKFAIDSIDIQIKPKKVEMMADLRVEKNFLKYSNLGFDDDKRNEHVKDDSQLYMHETVDLNDVSDPHMAQNSVNKSDAKSESLESTISFQSSEFKEENSSDYLHLSEEITNEISRNLKIGRIPDLYLKSEAITKKRFKEGPVIEIESSDMSHSLAHTSSNQERALTNNAHVFFPSIDSEFEESFERISLCLSDIPFQEDIIDTSNIQSISSKDADAKSENESIPSNNSGFQVVEKADSDNSIEVKNDHDEHVSNALLLSSINDIVTSLSNICIVEDDSSHFSLHAGNLSTIQEVTEPESIIKEEFEISAPLSGNTYDTKTENSLVCEPQCITDLSCEDSYSLQDSLRVHEISSIVRILDDLKLTSGLEECEVKNAIENNDPVSKLTIETELNSEKTKRHSSIKSVNKISEDVVLSLDAIEEIATSSFVPAILQELPATNISSITFENFKLINPTTTESTTTESTSSKLVTKSSSTFSESIPIELIDPTQLTVRNLNSNEKLNEEQTMTSLFLTAELKSVVIDCLSLVQNENESSIADSESEINTTCIDTNTLSLPFIDSLQNQDQNETNLIPKKPFHGVDMKIDTHSAIIRCKGMTNPPQNMIYQNKGHFREGNEQKESFNFTTHQFLSSVASFDESQLPFVNEPNDAYNSPCIPSFMHSRSCLDLKTETQELIVSFDTKDDDELSPQADDDIVVDALLELVKLITPLRGVELQISLLKHYMNQIQFINMNQPVKLDINVVEELCSAVMSVSLENHAYMIFEVLEEALEESRIKTIQKNKNVVGLGFDMTVNLIGQAQDKIELWFDTQVQANKPELVLSKELAVMIREFEESVESEIKKE